MYQRIYPSAFNGNCPGAFGRDYTISISTIFRYPGVLGGGIKPGTFSTMDMNMYHSLLGMG
jgi:hypothetical protein